MSGESAIEWTTKTWNLVNGCTRKSDGCEHCYITRQTPMRMRGAKWDRPGIGGTTGRVFFPERVTQPVRWLKPSLVFPNSMGDTFDLPDDLLVKMWAAMALAQHHTFQVLTKNHGNMRSTLTAPDFHRDVAEQATDMMGTGLLRTRQHALNMGDRWTTEPHPDGGGRLWLPPWPLPNVWLGVSVENQKWANLRIPALLRTPAAVRFLSCEPLLGAIDLYQTAVGPLQRFPDEPNGETGRIGWVIVGGESGKGARPMHPDWARSLRDQCVEAGAPFFFKQHGEWLDLGQSNALGLHNGGEVRAYPGNMLVKRVGKKAAGRLLDGREWNEFPTAVTR